MASILNAAKEGLTSASNSVVSATSSVAQGARSGLGSITEGVSNVADGVAKGAKSGIGQISSGVSSVSMSGSSLDFTAVPRAPTFVKMVVLGDAGVGKTSLIFRFLNKKFDEKQSPSLGCDMFVKDVLVAEQTFPLQIWDTSGRSQPFGYVLHRGANCAILVFDVTNAASFAALDNWRNELLVQASPADPVNFPFVVVGNKADREGRTVSQKDALQWCASKGATYVEASAKDDINVEQLFRTALLTIQ